MPMQLRMFAEEALGEPAPGTMPGQGKTMRGFLVKTEMGADEGGQEWHVKTLNAERMFR